MKYAVIPVTPFQQNCSLLVCEQTGRAAVIDPGGDVDRILAVLGTGGILLMAAYAALYPRKEEA